MENKLRELRAELEAKIQSEEAKALAAAQQARATAEAQASKKCVAMWRFSVYRQIMFFPQKQKRKPKSFEPREVMATIEENGKAMALVLQMLDAWLRAGNDAKDIFLIQQLEGRPSDRHYPHQRHGSWRGHPH